MRLLVKSVLFALVFCLSGAAMSVPNEAQKLELRKECVQSGVIKKLIEKKAKNCPASIKAVKPNEKNVKPIACLMTNQKDSDMTPSCLKAAKVVYEAIPRFFRPSLK